MEKRTKNDGFEGFIWENDPDLTPSQKKLLADLRKAFEAGHICMVKASKLREKAMRRLEKSKSRF
jgi:hypothetical protein